MGDKNDDKKTKETAPDPELDDLLDSALEDFSKKPTVAANKATVVEKVSAPAGETDASEGGPEWTEEFILQAAAQFESNMAHLLGSVNTGNTEVPEFTSDQMQQNLQKMAEAAAQVMINPQALEPTPQTNDFASAISQTLQNLSLGAENLQNPLLEQNLLSMFGGGGGGAAPGSDQANAFLPFMQGMMQSLLSKEVLYPSLKDILDRYPAWLQEHGPQLEEAERDRYTQQMALMKDVCTLLEQETETDAEAVKRERFDQVLQLMQKMQDLGQPPSELVGEMGPGLQFDAQGNPMMPPDLNIADPSQCSLM